MMLSTAWVLAQKDWRLFARDRTGLLLSLALPLFLATIFAAAMGGMGGSGGAGRVTLLVEDLDSSELSKRFIAELGRSPGLKVEAATEARKRVADGKAPAALLVPHGWGADVALERKSALKLYRDPGQTIEQQVIAGNLLPALFQSGDPHLSKSIALHGMEAFGLDAEQFPGARAIFDQTWDSFSELARQRAAPSAQADQHESDSPSFDFGKQLPALAGIDVEDVAGGDDVSQKSAMQSHAVSGIAVMMLLFGLVAAGGTILEEQGGGTLERLRLVPGSGNAILAGKFMLGASVGLLQLAILFVYGGVVFSVPIARAPLALCVHSLAVACAATSLGVFLAVYSQTRKQLEGFSTLIILVMSALGGSWFPLLITPSWYQKLGHFTLNAWAMDGYQGIFWYGKGLAGIWLPITVLFAIALVLGMLALRGWKRRFLSVA